MTTCDNGIRRSLGTLAVALALTGAGLPAAADQHDDADWEIVYLDDRGRETRRHNAAETVARVLGPRDTVLEIGCNPNSDNRYLRIARGGDREPQFAGEELAAHVEVFFGGRTIHDESLELGWRDEGYYQVRARARLGNALKEGIRVVFSDEDQDIRLPFTLRGSYVAISAVPCD
ncbi:hypothetical protein GE300_22230 [Rhodobacteraceae bacterium 2CG4]|uniref:Uncharacterized protein n=1 Tax=Halovulum marinum TaxID=2662447 RepID=A0A6L5Z6R3_9RHOB|nr:hypothetical protein [Halovulum marinum]MSU92251.1 hypothetical protein [Halovulum marinum]